MNKFLGGDASLWPISIFPTDLQKTGIDFIIISAYEQDKKGAKKIEDAAKKMVETGEKIVTQPKKEAEGFFNSFKTYTNKFFKNPKKTIVDTANGVENAREQVVGQFFKTFRETRVTFIPKGSVVLPLPEGLGETTSHDWNKSSSAANVAYQSMLTSANGVVKDGLAKINLSNMTEAVGTAARQGMEIRLKKDFFQDYEHTEPRRFTFSWMLIPKSLLETTTLLYTIMLLKYWTTPGTDTTDDRWLREPYVFKFKFLNPVLTYFYSVDVPSACTELSIDYNGQGYNDFTWWGSPKAIKLTISFAETSIITNQDLPWNYK